MKLFVTGTDTNVGKTYVSTALLRAATRLGLTCLGIKPIASGCDLIENKWRNEDAHALQQASSIKLSYEHINPFAFEPPIAPHLAAAKLGMTLNVPILRDHLRPALEQKAGLHIIEGAGGWLVPLNAQETMADFVKAEGFSVLLVVSMRLGCINHALLTYQAMHTAHIPIVGWIANCNDPNMIACEENIATLKAMLPISCLGHIAYQENTTTVFENIINQALIH